MDDQATLQFDGVERMALKVFTEKAYLDYSMYVILDRALPHLGDGLKPVQRRIVYAMRELGLSAAAKPKKSARTVGDVIGKFHPHGDAACYEAMVHMAQPFSTRYPLVYGHGNWGSSDDPKSFAAMRYTEARLTPYAAVLLSELGQGTVDWTANFDGTMEEPTMLPARLPNVLLNGATGIAVGMSTDIPPHNVREVVAALVHLLDKPLSTVEELCELIPGPDFPTGGELVSARDDLLQLYRTGSGSLRVRARCEQENGEIVITELPYQVSGSKILEQIAAQMRAKKLPMVEDLRDESDHENPVRLVICLRSNRVDGEALLDHLFATTEMERTVRVNFNVIRGDGRPGVMDLKSLLTEWLAFRTTTVTRRLQHRLDRVRERLHILDGLLIAFLNIDEVIAIIRTFEDPKAELMRRFALSDTQAEAILELKLRHLAKLEEIRIRSEQDELATERKQLEKILGSDAELRRLIRSELLADAEKYGDERRTRLVVRRAAQPIAQAELVPTEPVTIVLSQAGWVRAAKGHDVDVLGLHYRSGDGYLCAVAARSNQQAVFIDSTGRAYALSAHTLPSARGQGDPLTGRFDPPDGATFRGVMAGEPESLWVLATDAGYGFVVSLEELVSRNRAGKAVLTVPDRSGVLVPAPAKDLQKALLATVTTAGYLLAFAVGELPQLARGKGNKILGVPAAKSRAGEERLLAIATVMPHESLVVTSGQREMKISFADLTHLYAGERGRRGTLLPRGWQKVSGLAVAGATGV